MHRLRYAALRLDRRLDPASLQEQVLEARVRLLGKEHPNTLAAMNNLAQTLKELRKRRWWQFWRTP